MNAMEHAAATRRAATELQYGLAAKYAVTAIQVTISSGPQTFNIQGTDAVKGFVCASDNDWDTALREFTQQLTSLSEVRAAKLAQYAALQKELA